MNQRPQLQKAIGGIVWVLSRRQRGSITEAERTRLILDEQSSGDSAAVTQQR